MAIRTTYSRARENFAAIWNEVESTRRPAIVERRGHESMAILPADELSRLEETAHLLQSPKNAVRLLTALARSRKAATPPIDLEVLIAELDPSE